MESQEQHLEENKTVEESPGTCTGNLDNDVAMDLFLSQMDCYNPQHLSRQDVHNTNTVLDHSHLFATGDSHNLDTNIHQLPDLDVDGQQFYEQDNANKADVTASSSSNRSKAKNKSKDSSGGSSLLNAIANPLLHAIPILARNCLNFEDFLAQAALHGQNGLMGPKMTKPEDGSSDYAAPDKLMLDPSRERPMAVKIESRYHIRVLGLPETGAKSRVETQIKICLQLVDSSNNLTTDWSHLRLPEHMVAKEKLKRKNQKAGDDKLAMLESKVLNLEAAVVCDGHPDNEIIMCTSCVHRERKRLKRKRDNKVARAANKEGNAAKLAALFATDLPDLNDEEVMALERRKILLFNCNEYVEFGDGEATLPTRVTCYCRHHSEKVGFRIVFTLKDSHNHVIATGRSPPIMITDDHKSSKVQSTARKRTRTEYDASASEVPEPPPGSKKKIGDGETDSGVSSPVTSAPPTPASNGDDMAGNSPSSDKIKDDDRAPAGPSATTGNDGQSVSSSNTSKTAGTSNQSLLSHVQQPSTYRDSIQEIPRGELFDLLHSENVNVDHLLSSSDLNAPQPQNQAQQQQTIPLLNPNERLNSLLQPQSHQHILSRRRTTVSPTCSQQQWQVRDIYAKMQQKNASDSAKSTNVPRLHRLIPSEGPIYGGSEVTVLGSNFYEGLTCLFGENPAIPTHCWSNNTLLCILPPAASAGPVVVSFKEHPLMLESQDVVLFTYIDESDRALMELALQVVGLKTMGRVEDARQIAMRIVQGDTDGRKDSNGKSSNSSLNGLRLEYRQHLTVKAAAAVYDNARTLFIQRLEDQVIAALVAAMCMDTRYSGELSLTNRNKHSLLHLATICGYDRLVRVLLKLGCDVDQSDSNGFTALHFASWTGKVDIVQALISRANLDARNIMGKTAERMALEAGHHKVLEIFKRAPRKRQNRRKSKDKDEENAVRIPLTELIPAETVASARAVLPTRLNDMLSTFYTISVNTQCVKNLGMAVTHVYNFMLDPF